MFDSADASGQALCKKCKKQTNSGPKCIICGANYHTSCAKLIKKAKFINDNEVNCCAVSDTGEISDCESLAQSEDTFSSLRNEIKYLKSIIDHKDVIIKELDEKIHLLKVIAALREVFEGQLKNDRDNGREVREKVDAGKQAWLINSDEPPTVPFNLQRPATMMDKGLPNSKNLTNNRDGTFPPTLQVTIPSTSGVPTADTNTKTPQSNKEDGFILVQNKKKKASASTKVAPQSLQATKPISGATRKKSMIGSSASTVLKSVPKSAHLHLSRLDPDTKVENILDYIKPHVSKANCERLQSKNPTLYSSFKLSVPLGELEQVMNSSIWPCGVTINRFFFRRPQNNNPPNQSVVA
ncbi:uncharacterized protein LOC103312450 [Tribolium castaneum]|uniref:uncharacterized protein LOC103312450 n=1 Tax=Tribolium castaneum TaxID=7070 RepID=UPI0030FEDA47